MASIEERVEVLLQPIIEKLGYKLYDVQYVKEASNYYLRIFIEKENGAIDLDDCEKVNDGINDILDTADYIKDQYFLEVSSTGLEKVLRKDSHLQEHIGCEIMVNLFKSITIPLRQENQASKDKKKKQKEEKTKELIGILKAFDQESITLDLETEAEVKEKLESKLESQPELEIQENQTLKIERRDIAVIKTVYHWDDEI